jgi:protoporphyrinogen oxidase
LQIAILGGGISGTALARLCAADGHVVTVFEKASRPGGLCRSRVVDGFTFDEAGGHILFSKDRAVLDWMKERAGGEQRLVRKDRHTKIRWHDRWVPYPFENGVGHLPKETVVECLEGYLEAFMQRRLGTPCPPDFKGWIRWRMGHGFARHFMDPYNEKLWKCDLSAMASDWVAGRVPEAPLRDILQAAIGIDTQGYAHQAVFHFPLTGGFEAIVRGVVDGGGFRLRTNAAVEDVRRRGTRFQVDGEPFDLVVNTVPLPQIEPAFQEIPPNVRADIQALRPISLVNVLVGVKVDAPPPDYSWVYLPFPEQGPANRVTFFSNYSPHNAPPGHASFMAEVTHRGELRPTREWAKSVATQAGNAGLFDARAITLLDWSENEYAYISLDREFTARIARVRAWFDQSGYVTFGRFGRYEYHNSDQCVQRAMQVHRQIGEIARTGAPMQLALP